MATPTTSGWSNWGDRRRSWDSAASATTAEEQSTATPGDDEAEQGSQAAAPTAETTGQGQDGGSPWTTTWPNRSWYGHYWSDYGYGYDNWYSRDWGQSWNSRTAWASESETTSPPATMPELIPQFLQGWFLLQDSGLSIQERNLVQTALRGNYELQNVAAELRAQWPDSELQKRDRQPRGHGYLGEVIEEDEDEEAYAVEYDPAELQNEGMTEEGLVIMDEAESPGSDGGYPTKPQDLEGGTGAPIRGALIQALLPDGVKWRRRPRRQRWTRSRWQRPFKLKRNFQERCRHHLLSVWEKGTPDCHVSGEGQGRSPSG